MQEFCCSAVCRMWGFSFSLLSSDRQIMGGLPGPYFILAPLSNSRNSKYVNEKNLIRNSARLKMLCMCTASQASRPWASQLGCGSGMGASMGSGLSPTRQQLKSPSAVSHRLESHFDATTRVISYLCVWRSWVVLFKGSCGVNDENHFAAVGQLWRFLQPVWYLLTLTQSGWMYKIQAIIVENNTSPKVFFFVYVAMTCLITGLSNSF